MIEEGEDEEKPSIGELGGRYGRLRLLADNTSGSKRRKAVRERNQIYLEIISRTVESLLGGEEREVLLSKTTFMMEIPNHRIDLQNKFRNAVDRKMAELTSKP